jgi:hypothetical protein
MCPNRWIIGLALLSLAAVGLVMYGAPIGPGDFDEECDVDLLDYMYLMACLSTSGPGTQPGPDDCLAAYRGFDFDLDNDVDMVDVAAFQRVFTGKGVPAVFPPKHLTFDNIGIHDLYSENYDEDCTACHLNRTAELALDGVTPTAHNRMLCVLGELEWLCAAACHLEVDFRSSSAANLRKQVALDDELAGVNCLGCHCRGVQVPADIPDFYDVLCGE